ncbi:MAG: hypothetical protein LPK19_15510, partial [Hymenobacteraceae bacterium]|nr:hypothetical protein [Hymenobacteraceae bacterium]MDX5397644.1 hypothetical protein [Hymenobacteraceae bacterium]MDX5513722.1 hypothetical protein [Hymenobacteraceae bacterium]
MAAIKFVQNEVRYLGIESGVSSHKPFPPGQVYQQRYGDCKDKANLLCYMLQQMNIKAYPALVNTQSRSGIKDWLPNPQAFNHCVVQVQLLGKTFWVDATMTNQEGPYDNIYFPAYGYALVISPSTTGLTEIAASTNSKLVVEESYLLDSEEKSADLKVVTNYFGYEADVIRDYFASNSNADISKSYLNFYAAYFPNIKESEELLSVENRSTNSYVVHENYKIDDVWEVSTTNPDEKVAIYYPQIIDNKIVTPNTKIRSMPYALEYPLHYEQTINVYMTEPTAADSEKLVIEENGIYFSKEVTYKNNVLSQKYIYKTTKPHIEAADISAFIATQNKVKKELGYSITKYTGNGAAAASGFNYMFLLFIAIGLAIGGLCIYKMYHHDPLPHPEHSRYPLSIGGWVAFVLVGLCITPIRVLIQIISTNYVDLATWKRLGDPKSSFYNPDL